MKKFQFKKRYIIYILVIPILFISFISWIVKFGTKHINTNEIIINFNKEIGLGDYLTYYISILGIEATSILSFMLYRTSVRSNELAEEIKKKEENRDDEKIKESALIIYYDFISKISIIKELYTKYILNIDIDINKNIIMQDEWLKNLTNLRDILSREELDKLFQIYNRFELIARFQKEGDDKHLKEAIKHISEDIFLSALHKYLWMDYHVENECLLNYDYYKIFIKIKEKIDNKKINQRIYSENITDFTLFDGKDTYRYKNGRLVYEFEYVKGKIVKGKYFNYINNVYESIFEGELDNKFNIVNGYTIKFNKNMGITYMGEIKNSKYDGDGILFYNCNGVRGEFTGVFKNGKKHRGLWTAHDGITYFNGEYKNDRPYTGEIECSKSERIGGAYGFKGKIEEGKPINGDGYVKNGVFRDEEFIKQYPECIEENDNYEQEYDNYEQEYDNYVRAQLTDKEYNKMIEDDIRYRKEMDKYNYIEECGIAVELLESTWENGKCIKAIDDGLNKDYIPIDIKSKYRK